MKYQRKPLTVTAVQFQSDNQSEIAEFCKPLTEANPREDVLSFGNGSCTVIAQGVHNSLEEGDWIVRDGNDFSPYKAAFFAANYEAVSATDKEAS